MKKLTLAALVIGSFAASAHAQSQSNVTVYGLVDLGLAKSTNGTAIERENHASRLGFKGAEDLGGGLSAIFNLETEILADTGAQKGALFDRRANVGLKGGFGTVYMGRSKNLVDAALARVEPFAVDGIVGKVNEKIMRVEVSASRVKNSISYESPNLNGVVLGAQYVLSEVAGASAGYDLLATYDNGPISLHVGYEQAVQELGKSDKPTMYVVGGAYAFGPAKVTAAYAKGDKDDGADTKNTGYLLGFMYAIGGGDAKAVYGKGEGSAKGKSDVDTAKEFGIGYDYHLSKRTDLYAYAGRGTDLKAYTGRTGVPSVTSYQMGISHKF